jgi:hypothetical protein
MIIDGTNGLTFNNSTTQASAGNVLQVVQGTTTTGTTVSVSASYAATNLSASITPKFSTSKVLVMINGMMYASTGTGEPQGAIYRNGSNVGNYFTDLFSASGAIVSGASAVYLDSPATTSSTTYAFYFKTSVAGYATFPVNGATATITLMEIAG